MTVQRLGDRALRFARPVGVDAAAIVEVAKGWVDVVDVVVTSTFVAVYFARAGEHRIDETQLAALPATSRAMREVELPARYDGPDLDEVARATGRSVDELVALHASTTFVVETMGFAPGFAYMTGLPAALHVPRRSTPRTRVPGGSIAIAAQYTAVYPFDSPGGWHLIGRVIDTRMFDERGARLQLGDRVRFEAR